MAPEEVEADIQHFYPGRLLGEWYCTIAPSTVAANRGQDYVDRMLARNEGMTSRELYVLIEKLPEDSETSRKLKSAWTTAEILAAHHLNAFASVNFEDPEPITPETLTKVIPRHLIVVESPKEAAEEQISDEELQAIVFGTMNLSDLM